jgi:lipid II:glycine glycyltransferase (peptidoglycan interpeptide bridge formation enzyme)
VPRGPVFSENKERKTENKNFLRLLEAARKAGAGWVRVDPANQIMLEEIGHIISLPIKKAPHDMQPREILVMNIEADEATLLSKMKSKTRYNIRLAEKRGVNIFTSREKKYQEKFLDLVEVTAKRDNIVPHPRSYYQKMFEVLPEPMLRLYIAEHESEVLAANAVLFFGRYATYLHGASSNEKRFLMAPYLLQWRQIQDAKRAGCAFYDFGGIHTLTHEEHAWAGITRFKIGFAPLVHPTVFPGSYDVVIDPKRYMLYRFLQKVRGGWVWLKKIS